MNRRARTVYPLRTAKVDRWSEAWDFRTHPLRGIIPKVMTIRLSPRGSQGFNQ
jgi:hypothetical protein